MVEQAVEHRADGGCISQKFSPVFDRAIRSQHSAGPFIPSHDDLQQFFGSGQWQLAHPEIVEDEQGNPELHYVFAQARLAEERGLGIRTLRSVPEKYGLPAPRYSFEDP